MDSEACHILYVCSRAAQVECSNYLAGVPPFNCFSFSLTGAELSDSCLYERLINSALNQETSDLMVIPTILGERHNPLSLGQVNNISTTNLSLGHLTRALCRGVLDNISSMMPAERLQEAGVTRIVGSGSAIAHNEVLRQEVERAFPQPVVYGQNADSAVGVAMVLCDRHLARVVIHSGISVCLHD